MFRIRVFVYVKQTKKNDNKNAQITCTELK